MYSSCWPAAALLPAAPGWARLSCCSASAARSAPSGSASPANRLPGGRVVGVRSSCKAVGEKQVAQRERLATAGTSRGTGQHAARARLLATSRGAQAGGNKQMQRGRCRGSHACAPRRCLVACRKAVSGCKQHHASTATCLQAASCSTKRWAAAFSRAAGCCWQCRRRVPTCWLCAKKQMLRLQASPWPHSIVRYLAVQYRQPGVSYSVH